MSGRVLKQKRKNGFGPVDVSCFLEVLVEKIFPLKRSRSVPEVFGTIPDLFRLILDQFWTILDQNRLTNYIRKIPITNNIQNPITILRGPHPGP